MSMSRRAFVRTLGVGGAGALTASAIGGRVPTASAATIAPAQPFNRLYDAGFINLSSNTSPRGPSEAVLDVLRSRINSRLARYPENVGLLTEAIAAHHDVATENVLLSTGTGEELEGAVHTFVSTGHALVAGSPSYESPGRTADRAGLPVHRVPVDSTERLDFDSMASAAQGAGLVYVCNPNNPTGLARSGAQVEELVTEIKRTSPDTVVLIDEAYLEFAADPEVRTAVPLALAHPGVVVTKTFSKVYALAGLRLGYAVGQPATLDSLRSAWGYGSVTVLSAAAGIAALGDQAHVEREIAANKAVRDFTIAAFREMGYDVTDSETNFVWVDVRQPAAAFRDACFERGVLVGRDFPPMQNSHSRISLGSMDEMRTAVETFEAVLLGTAASAG